MAQTPPSTAVPRPDCAARRDRLREQLRAADVPAALITRLVNVRYLTGFTGSNGALLVGADGTDVFCTDGRYRIQAGRQAPDLDLRLDRASAAALAAHAGAAGIGRLGFEPHDVTVDLHATLADRATGAE